MRVNYYEGLSLEKQIQVLYKKGVYVGKQRKEGRILVLYQLESFYVEVHYLKYRATIASLRCFENMSELDPYLEGIDIERLVYF